MDRKCENGKNSTKVYQMVTRLDRCTPGYIGLSETNREKIRIKAGRITMKFEEGART